MIVRDGSQKFKELPWFLILFIHEDAEFWFSQLSYHVTESAGFINVCLVLVKGTLIEDITIQIKSIEITATCKDIL